MHDRACAQVVAGGPSDPCARSLRLLPADDKGDDIRLATVDGHEDAHVLVVLGPNDTRNGRNYDPEFVRGDTCRCGEGRACIERNHILLLSCRETRTSEGDGLAHPRKVNVAT